MKALFFAIWLILFLVFFGVFFVLFQYGPSGFSEGAKKEIARIGK